MKSGFSPSCIASPDTEWALILVEKNEWNPVSIAVKVQALDLEVPFEIRYEVDLTFMCSSSVYTLGRTQGLVK